MTSYRRCHALVLPFLPGAEGDMDMDRFIRVTWCDTANVIRCKAVYGSCFQGLDEGIALCIGNLALPVMHDEVTPGSGLGPVGDLHLMPDWKTIRSLPYSKGHVRVMGDMFSVDGVSSPLCPRSFLRNMAEKAAGFGLHLKAAFENEFILLRPSQDNGRLVPVDETSFCMTFAMDTSHDVLADICDSLIKQDIVIEQCHSESANGQFEIPILYQDALRAADEQVIFRETVKAVAHKHNMVASFLPKTIADQAGSGTHLHLSLHNQEGKNLVPSSTKAGELSVEASHFIAGLLEHLPGLMAITTPTTNSYRRIKPLSWSGAYQVWGYENKECAVRVPLNMHSPSPTHFELKTCDATANPYLALGAVLVAGLDGISRKLPLGAPLQVDPGRLSETELAAKNVCTLPRSLDVALTALSCDEVLMNTIPRQLSQTYLAVKWAEYKHMNGLSFDDEVKLLMIRY